jgi:hypothetical protein
MSNRFGDMSDYPWKDASLEQLQNVLPTLLDQLSPERGQAMLEMVRSIYASGATSEQLDVWEGSTGFNGLTPPPAMAILPAINAPLASTTQQVAFSLELTIADSNSSSVRECNMGTFVIIQQPWFAWDKIDTFVEWGINTKYYLTGADMGNGPTLCKQLPIGASAQYDPSDVASSWLGPYGVPTLMLPPKMNFSDTVNSQAIFADYVPYVTTNGTGVLDAFRNEAAQAYSFSQKFPQGYNWGPYNYQTTWTSGNGYLWNPGYLMPKTEKAEKANSATYTAILVHAPPTYQFQAGMNLAASYSAGRIISLMFSCYVTPNPTGTNGNGKVTIGLLTDALQPTYTRDTIQQQAGKNYSHNALQLNGQTTKKGGGIYILGTNTLQQFKPLQPSLESGLGSGGKVQDAFVLQLNPHGCANYHLSTTGSDPWAAVVNGSVTYPSGPTGPFQLTAGAANGFSSYSTWVGSAMQPIYALANSGNANALLGGPPLNIASATVFVKAQSFNDSVGAGEFMPEGGMTAAFQATPYRLTAWNWTASGGGASGASSTSLPNDPTQANAYAASGVNDRIGGAYTQVCFVSSKADCFGTFAQMQEKHSNEALMGHWVSGLYSHVPFSGSCVQPNVPIANFSVPQWPNGLNPIYHLVWSIGCGATRACDLGKGCHLWMRAKGDGRLEQATLPFALGRWAGCAAPPFNGIGAPLPQDLAALGFNSIDQQVTSVGTIAYPDRVATYNGLGADVLAGGSFDQYRLTIRVPNYAPSTSMSDTRDKWTYIGTFFFFPAMTDAKMSVACTVEYPRYYDTGITDVAYVTRIDGLTEKQQFEGSLITNNEVIANSQTAGLNSSRLTAAPKMPLGNEFPDLIDLLFRNPNSRFFKCTFKPDEWSKAIREMYNTNSISEFFMNVILKDQGALDNIDRVVHCIRNNSLPAISANQVNNPMGEVADAIRSAARNDAREAAADAVADQLESGGLLGKLFSGVETALKVANGAAQGLQVVHSLLGGMQSGGMLGAAGGLSTGGMLGAAGGLSTGGMLGADGDYSCGGMLGAEGDLDCGGILGDVLGLLADGTADLESTGLISDDNGSIVLTRAGTPNHVTGGRSVAGAPFKTPAFVNKFMEAVIPKIKDSNYSLGSMPIVNFGKAMLYFNQNVHKFMSQADADRLNKGIGALEAMQERYEKTAKFFDKEVVIDRPTADQLHSRTGWAMEGGRYLQKLYVASPFQRIKRNLDSGELEYGKERTHYSNLVLPWEYHIIFVRTKEDRTIPWSFLSSNHLTQIVYMAKHGRPQKDTSRIRTISQVFESAIEVSLDYTEKVAMSLSHAIITPIAMQQQYISELSNPTQWNVTRKPYVVPGSKRDRMESAIRRGQDSSLSAEQEARLRELGGDMKSYTVPDNFFDGAKYGTFDQFRHRGSSVRGAAHFQGVPSPNPTAPSSRNPSVPNPNAPSYVPPHSRSQSQAADRQGSEPAAGPSTPHLKQPRQPSMSRSQFQQQPPTA